MKSFKKLFLSLFLVSALALAGLTACGGNDAPAEESASQEHVEEAEASEEPDIEIYNAWSRPTPDMVNDRDCVYDHQKHWRSGR